MTGWFKMPPNSAKFDSSFSLTPPHPPSSKALLHVFLFKEILFETDMHDREFQWPLLFQNLFKISQCFQMLLQSLIVQSFLPFSEVWSQRTLFVYHTLIFVLEVDYFLQNYNLPHLPF